MLSRGNLADITYISPGSSVEDNFDEIICENEATTDSVFELNKLCEVEKKVAVEQGCDLPSKIRRSHAFRRKVSTLKRQLASDSSGASTVASGGKSDGNKGGQAPEQKKVFEPVSANFESACNVDKKQHWYLKQQRNRYRHVHNGTKIGTKS